MDGHALVKAGNPDDMYFTIRILVFFALTSRGDNANLMAQVRQTMRLGISLGANAAAGGLGRILLRNQTDSHKSLCPTAATWGVIASSTSCPRTLSALKYSAAS